MKIPAEFDCIRPFEPEELPEVFDRLLSDSQFQQVLAYLYPGVALDDIAAKMRACKTNIFLLSLLTATNRKGELGM